jgi:pimeloyl-ACP methyl ester carboxylesterase
MTPDGFRWRRVVRLVAAALFAVTTILLLGSYALSRQYVSAITEFGCPSTQLQPGDLGLSEFEDVWFTTSDGVELSGWYVPGTIKATIILAGGMGTRDGMLPEGLVLARHGYGLLLFDWRGCGRSGAASHTLGYREALDIDAAAEFLADETDTEQIGVLGFSLGGAAAIRSAAYQPAIDAVVAMGNYHDLEAEIFGAGNEHPLLTAIFESQIAWLFQQETGIDFERDPEPVELISLISPRPILLIYGEEEEALPPPSGRILLQAAREPKELWILPNVGHGGYVHAEPEEFERRVARFFDSAFLP